MISLILAGYGDRMETFSSMTLDGEDVRAGRVFA
jgi:hypothetical protein